MGNDGSGMVSVIERASLTVVHTLEVGSDPVALALDADGRFAFSGTAAEGRVSVIDIDKMREVDLEPEIHSIRHPESHENTAFRYSPE